MSKQRRISFGRSEVLDTTSGESQTAIYIDGDDVGTILKEVYDASGSMGWYPQWVAAGYTVEFVVEPAPADRYFDVDDYGPGTTTRERRTRARKALAAAKAHAAGGWT